MQTEQPYTIVKESANDSKAWRSVLFETALTSLAIYASTSGNWGLWLIGQGILAISMFHWFVLMHDMGHGGFFSNRKWNIWWGHMASLICLIPFFPWKSVHHTHHVWTGWAENDPTRPHKELTDMPDWAIRFMNFCWKYWIPIFVVSFCAETFYNLNRLGTLYPSKKRRRQHVLSIGWIIGIHLLVALVIGKMYFQIFGLAFLLNILFSDPILLSQHTHLDQHHVGDQKVRPHSFKDQDLFTRTLIYPAWYSRYILYHFDKHGFHHQHPTIPSYHLEKYGNANRNTIHWWEWLIRAKAIPASTLIYQSYKDTNIRL
ncbi:MAG: fatty acid desaturase [Bacteroidota bacterium]